LAKKKKIIDLRVSNIQYEENDLLIKVLCLNTFNMTVDLKTFEKDIFVEDKTIPFAHLPKSIKKLVKPV